MKITIGFTGIILSMMLMAFVSEKPHTDVYKVDVNASSLEWNASKVTGKHNGTIKISKGEIKNNHGNITGSIEIDMNSIENTDLKPGASKTKLESHLKSADFFDIEKFPKSKFVITAAIPIINAKAGTSNYTIKGLLTIKDKTNEISFPASLDIEDNDARCIGTAVVDRSKFDVKYGSKAFFPNIGDKMIHDEFTLKFNIVAVK